MSTQKTINAGQQDTLGPSESRVYTFSWDPALAAGVTIVTQAFVVLEGDGSLTVDTSSPLGIQADGRTIKFRLSTPTDGVRYRVASRVTTSETPDEIKQQSFFILGQER